MHLSVEVHKGVAKTPEIFTTKIMNWKKHFYLLSLVVICSLGCFNKTPIAGISPTVNAKKARSAPYVILMSLDGYRWDYTRRFNPPNLSKLIENGVQAESLIPCFPSKTFPNHYSIATGMYPDHHGLLDNSFYNLEKNKVYKISDRNVVEDGSWYGGSPIWVQAARAGMVTASFFFVGSEADVQGIRPTYYQKYDGSVKNEDRVHQALKWLNMPENERPHLITMYFSDMDDRGHRVGPNNDEKLTEAILALDESLGSLFDGVQKTGLPVNIIIVSDHGMLEVPTEKYIAVESIENDDAYLTVSNGAIVHIYLKNEKDLDRVFGELKEKENHFKVYKTAETPEFEIPVSSANWGDLQIIPEDGWYFSPQRSIGLKKARNIEVSGEHGFSIDKKELHGIFYANGPAFKKGLKIPSVKNIHIYPLICEILGMEVPAEVDGSLEVLSGILEGR